MRRVALIQLLMLPAAPCVLATAAAQSVPLQVCGQLPRLEHLALSPDGTRIAFLKTDGDLRLIRVLSLTSKKIRAE